MKMFMKYPNIVSNSLCDGATHQIYPLELNSFYHNGMLLYQLTYIDQSYGCDCTTILRFDNGNFYKVPLYDYNDYNNKIRNGQILLNYANMSMLLDGSTIETDKPYNSIDDVGIIKENQAHKADDFIPRKRECIILYVDDNGNIYISSGAALAVFGIRTSNQYYALTLKQLMIILNNYGIEWHHLINGYDNKLDLSSNKLMELLQKYCAKNGITIDNLIKYKEIYVVINNAQDEDVYRGKFNKNNLLSGLSAFVYNEGKYEKTYLSSSRPYSYLKDLTESLKENEFLPIEDVEPLRIGNIKYEFIGGYELISPSIDRIDNCELDLDIKNTLSSSLLGHTHSNCYSESGLWINDLLENRFDIKQIRDNKKTR